MGIGGQVILVDQQRGIKDENVLHRRRIALQKTVQFVAGAVGVLGLNPVVVCWLILGMPPGLTGTCWAEAVRRENRSG